MWTRELGQATKGNDAAPGAGLEGDERDEGSDTAEKAGFENANRSCIRC